MARLFQFDKKSMSQTVCMCKFQTWRHYYCWFCWRKKKRVENNTIYHKYCIQFLWEVDNVRTVQTFPNYFKRIILLFFFFLSSFVLRKQIMRREREREKNRMDSQRCLFQPRFSLSLLLYLDVIVALFSFCVYVCVCRNRNAQASSVEHGI